MADPEFGEWLANELVSMLEAMPAETELRTLRGDKIVEIRPVWANKSEAHGGLRQGCSDPDFVFAAGDDRADEDLFERLPTTLGQYTSALGLRVPHLSSPISRDCAEYWGCSPNPVTRARHPKSSWI
jgi:trehalose-6-phosphatase